MRVFRLRNAVCRSAAPSHQKPRKGLFAVLAAADEKSQGVAGQIITCFTSRSLIILRSILAQF